MICSFEGCECEVVAHTLCRGHVTQKYRKQELKPLRGKASKEKAEPMMTPEMVTKLWKARLTRR